MKFATRLLALALPLTLTLGAADKGWDHYKKILDKGMFPKVPVAKPPTKAAPAPAPAVQGPKWEIDYKITTVYEHFRTGEIMVGVQNVTNQKNFLLRPGQKANGDKIKIETVTRGETSDDPIVVELTNVEASETKPFDFTTAVAMPVSAPTRSASRGPTRTTSSSRGGPPPRSGIRPSGSSYHRSVSTPKLSGQQIEKHLQDYQKEVIKKGLPLLPVALPEKDIRELQAQGHVVEDQPQPNGRSSGRGGR